MLQKCLGLIGIIKEQRVTKYPEHTRKIFEKRTSTPSFLKPLECGLLLEYYIASQFV
jgi:hypothetical protein